MGILVDTNLLRRTQPDHEHYWIAVKSVARLLAEETPLYFTLQNISEFWNVATRPIANNGLGFLPRHGDGGNRNNRMVSGIPS